MPSRIPLPILTIPIPSRTHLGYQYQYQAILIPIPINTNTNTKQYRYQYHAIPIQIPIRTQLGATTVLAVVTIGFGGKAKPQVPLYSLPYILILEEPICKQGFSKGGKGIGQFQKLEFNKIG